MTFPRLRASRSVLLASIALTVALLCSLVGTTLQRDNATAQGVSWLGTDSVSYLTSSGIPVMVPSWLPGAVAGSAPELYAGGGSYSVYFYAGSSFLFITGVAGGGFPGGSEANLNVELSVNTSVQGWPAIQDIGIPEGSDQPIYDKVMWIADGVLYTISGNGLGTDSLSLANSSVALYAAPAAPEPEPTSPPAPSVPSVPSQPPADTGSGSGSGNGSSDTTAGSNNDTVAEPSTTGGSSATTGSTTTSESTGSGVAVSSEAGDVSTEAGIVEPTPTPAGSSDGTTGAWFTGALNDDPSDGTDGANPPFLGGDGTGGPP